MRGADGKPIKEEPSDSHDEAESPVIITSRLRARKQVSYVQDEDGDSDLGGKDKDQEWKGKEAAKRARKRSPVKRPSSPSSSSAGDSSDEEDDYEKLRQKNIRERLELVKSLGIADLKEEIAGPSKKKELKPKKPVTPRDKSKRLRQFLEDKIAREARRKMGKPSPKKSRTDLVHSTLEDLRVTLAKATSRKPSGPLPMLSLKGSNEENSNEETDDAASKCAEFVSLLRPFLVHRGDESQLSTCSLDTFKKIVSRLRLTEDMIAKTNTARITSMAFHPADEKVLLASGSTSGDLGLWDVYNPDEEKCVEVLGPHTKQVNCTSFDKWNPSKIITSSLDGTVRRGDLMKLVFDEIWAHDPTVKNSHATWHDQVDPNTLMVAHGTGRVAVIDCRKPLQAVGWFKCHERSARTVHKHPMDNKIFVTASGDGQTVRIWDWRMMNEDEPQPIWDLAHPNGLTSAFFSCKGNLLLTTCNDDRLRVYHTALLPGASKPKVVTNIKHDNHTGPWVSVFKAMWHPQREDVFMIASMNKTPKQLQIYGIHGQPVYNLTSENLLTIPAVHAWHPTLPLIAGANAAGRVHVFK